MIAILLIVIFFPMLVEARRAAANERAQRRRGGVEAPGDVYAIMRVAYPVVFVAMIAEGLWRATPPTGLFFVGLSVFAATKALKWWAIVTLGEFWTFRVIVVPGATLVASGPYAYLRHPNYVAVVGELVAVWLMANARVTGPIATVAFGLLILKRISVEERALRHANLGGTITR